MFSLTRHLICLVLYLYLFCICICICICLVWHATLFVFLAALSRFLRRVPGQKQKKRENTSQSFGHNKIKFTSCLVVKLATYLYLYFSQGGQCQDRNRRKGKTHHKALVAIKSNSQVVQLLRWQLICICIVSQGRLPGWKQKKRANTKLWLYYIYFNWIKDIKNTSQSFGHNKNKCTSCRNASKCLA